MALIRPAANLVVDNPHADGLLAKHGFAYDWRFEPGKDERPAEAESLRPQWLLDGCEIVPVVHALGLRGYAEKADMDLGRWAIEAGQYWKTAKPAGRPLVDHLFCYDARPNTYGIVLSQDEYEPRVAAWLWRFSPPDGQTEPVMVEVTLHGNGLGPAYTVQAPLHDHEYKYPRLWRHEPGEPAPHLVDELGRYDAARLGMADGAAEQQLWIEETDGVLVVSIAGAAEPWVYKPEDGRGPSRGHVSVTIRGHCAMFNLQPIQYPASGTARPSGYLTVPDWMSPTPQYLPVTGGEGAVSVSEDLGGEGTTRPIVSLTRIAPDRRPLAYLVHQYHQPTFSAGESNPQSTMGDENLMRLRWRRRLGRGWSFEAELLDFDGAYQWRGNEKVTVSAGWQAADEQVMVGYLQGPARKRDAGGYVGRATAVVEGRDCIAARLRGRKFMAWHGSPVGWSFAAWFRYVLLRAGVPDALIVAQDDGYTIDAMPERWRSRYDFGNDTEVAAALDAVVGGRGWMWGIDRLGRIWTGPEPQYGGVPDFVLDDAAVAEADRIVAVEAERAAEAFRNYVAVFAGRDNIDAAIWHDEASHRDPASAAFIGDDWWDVVVAADEPNPAMLAWQTFSEARRERCDLVWETAGRPGLRPGMFVQMRVGGLGVPEEAVFQIVEDAGRMDVKRGVFRSLFLARAVDI